MCSFSNLHLTKGIKCTPKEKSQRPPQLWLPLPDVHSERLFANVVVNGAKNKVKKTTNNNNNHSCSNSTLNIYSNTYQRLLLSVSCTDSTILGEILNTANDKLVTQVLCFMFSPSLSNVSHRGWDHQANCSPQKNGPIDSLRNNFSGGSI